MSFSVEWKDFSREKCEPQKQNIANVKKEEARQCRKRQACKRPLRLRCGKKCDFGDKVRPQVGTFANYSGQVDIAPALEVCPEAVLFSKCPCMDSSSLPQLSSCASASIMDTSSSQEDSEPSTQPLADEPIESSQEAMDVEDNPDVSVIQCHRC